MKLNKNRLLISIIVLFASTINLHGQTAESRFKISGKIIDARNKKGIKRIPFIVMPYNRKVEADVNGAFLFNMPARNSTFVIDYYPFIKKEVKIDLKSDTTVVIELSTPKGMNFIEEVEVIASRPATEQSAGLSQIDSHSFKTIPAMIGERDILKAFTLTSGVTSSSEGAADIQVRGGLHGQNLYLLDGIPLYSTEHFFGMVSVYNPLIIKSAKLYKSDFPTEYGGKISSVVNVLTEDANIKKFSGAAEINLLSTKLALNVPILKDKLALAISGRISNYSLINIMSLLGSSNDNTKIWLHFGDINANLSWRVSAKDKLKLTWFNNSDGIDVAQDNYTYFSTIWINNMQQNLGLNWYRTISDKAENHLLAYTDSYNFVYGGSQKGTTIKFSQLDEILTGINSSGLEDKFHIKISDQLKLTAGGSVKLYRFSPVQLNHTDTLTRIKSTTLVSQTEAVLFAETEYQISEKQRLTAGLRFNTIINSDKIFSNIEPRIGYHGIFSNDFSISASIGRMSQPVHRVANPGLGIPFEMFLPSSAALLPETSWNFSLGAAKDFAWDKSKFSFKADAWYKSMKNIVEFQDSYDVMTSMLYRVGISEGVNNIVTQGNGKAYGLDLSADYSQGQWSVSVNYTLMQATNQFTDLNYGRPFAASTDITHSLSLSGELKLSPTWILSATWQYHSGKPITVPTAVFSYPTFNPITGVLDNSTPYFQMVETERNNYRTKPFHKLDVSFTHNYQAFRKKYNASLSLGIYNLYNQVNPYLYFIGSERKPDGSYKPILQTMSMFPIMPSFNWSVKF